MARTQETSKQDILEAASKFIVLYGPSKFKARQLAEYMGISTQPLYQQFKNMLTLRDELLEYFYEKLKNDYDNNISQYTPIVNLMIGFSKFPNGHPIATEDLLKDLFSTKKDTAKKTANFSYELFLKFLSESSESDDLNEEEIRTLAYCLWISATGISNFMRSGTAVLTDDELGTYFNGVIKNMKKINLDKLKL